MAPNKLASGQPTAAAALQAQLLAQEKQTAAPVEALACAPRVSEATPRRGRSAGNIDMAGLLYQTENTNPVRLPHGQLTSR